MSLPDWLAHLRSLSVDSNRNPNEFFSRIEFWLVRALVFLLFVVGLGKVGWELMEKLLR